MQNNPNPVFECEQCGILRETTFKSQKNPRVCKKCDSTAIKMIVTMEVVTGWNTLAEAKNHIKEQNKYEDSHEKFISNNLDWLPINWQDMTEDMYDRILDVKIKYKK